MKNIFSYLQKLSAKFHSTLAKQLILHGFEQTKKNLPKWKIWVGWASKIRFFFFFFPGLSRILYMVNFKTGLVY